MRVKSITFVMALLLFAGSLVGCVAPKEDSRYERLFEQMTIEEKVGQMVQIRVIETVDEGFLEGASREFVGMPSEETKEMIQESHVGSVVLYSSLDPSFSAEYTNVLQQWANETKLGIPLIIAADFETGPGYSTFRGVDPFPQQMGVAATRSTALAEEIAGAIARQSRAMGIHWNYSPVADVNTNPFNPVIGVRSFGDDPDLVSSFVAAYVRGYQSNGMIATAKHYPGHGDTSVDSHLDLPKISQDIETMRKIHLKPFQAAIDSDVDSVMTAHILIEQTDKSYPATLSPEILTGLLREEQNFNGIIVTDGMSMGGIVKHFGIEEASVLAVKAGADVVMATGGYGDQVRTYNGILEAVKRGEISEERIDESVRKILEQKQDLGIFENAFVDPGEASACCSSRGYHELALNAARRSITLLKNQGGLLPLSEHVRSVLVTGPVGAEDIAKQLERKIEKVVVYETSSAEQSNGWSPSARDIRKAKRSARSVDAILVTTYSSFKPPIAEGQVRLVEELKETGKPVVVVSLGLPYDVASLPPVDAYLATYSLNRWQSPRTGYGSVPLVYCQAIAGVVCGDFNPVGRLPVQIPNTGFDRGSGLSYK